MFIHWDELCKKINNNNNNSAHVNPLFTAVHQHWLCSLLELPSDWKGTKEWVGSNWPVLWPPTWEWQCALCDITDPRDRECLHDLWSLLQNEDPGLTHRFWSLTSYFVPFFPIQTKNQAALTWPDNLQQTAAQGFRKDFFMYFFFLSEFTSLTHLLEGSEASDVRLVHCQAEVW